MVKERSCCFTGHRSLPFFELNQIRERLTSEIERLIEYGVDTYISGGALGFDTIAAEIIIDLRKKHPNIKLVFALPCRDQASKWDSKDTAHYFELLEQCDEKHYISETCSSEAMLKRNRWMIEQSSYCIAYLTNKQRSGTAHTCNYAVKKGSKLINIA